MTTPPRGVAVLGLGYVGCVTAACLAKLGHRVIGVDRDRFKVESVKEGRPPFYEPGLDVLVRDGVASGMLGATGSLEEALDEASIAMICVGTPSERNGNLGLEQLRRVVSELAGLLPSREHPLIVAIRSTVFPGTCEEVVAPLLGDAALAPVVSNPEFLREGSAVRDFEEAALLVCGSDSAPAARAVATLYEPLGLAPAIVSLRTAELIKYACNAFHAVKIAFANEIGTLAGAHGIDAQEVMDAFCRDSKLNISTAYLKPGFAFGGSCLPKDLRALSYRARSKDLRLPLVDSVLPSNEEHLRRSIQAVMELPARKIGIFGLAFKENTDDLRESPVVALLEHLIGKGREVRVFDPHIRLDQIYGSNQNFLLNAIPHIGKLLNGSLDELLNWADHLVIAQRPSRENSGALAAGRLPVLDLTRG